MKDLTKSLEVALDNDVQNFNNQSLDDDKKAKSLQIISKEYAIILAAEKQDIDKQKFEKQTALDGQKLAAELSKMKTDKLASDKDYELRKLTYDLQKTNQAKQLDFQERQIALQEKQSDIQQKQNTITTIVAVAGIIIPALVTLISKIMYFKLSKRAQDHEYNDYAMEPKSSVENRSLLTKN